MEYLDWGPEIFWGNSKNLENYARLKNANFKRIFLGTTFSNSLVVKTQKSDDIFITFPLALDGRGIF